MKPSTTRADDSIVSRWIRFFEALVMAELGRLYRYRLRERGDVDADWRVLGDVDHLGTRLIDVLPEALEAIDHVQEIEGFEDPQSVVTFSHPVEAVPADTAGAVFHDHLYGSSGVLNLVEEEDQIPFTPIDNTRVGIGLLMSARPRSTAGFMVFHQSNGRSIKTAVEGELRHWFATEFGLFLQTSPVAPTEAVQAAIEDGGLGPITFRKLERPAGLFENERDWWDDGEKLGSAEHRLRPSRGQRFRGGPLLRFLRTVDGSLASDEEPIGFPELATFDDKQYDQLVVDLRIHGREKKVYFDASGASMSHAFSWDLDIGPAATDEVLFEALAELLVDADE